MKKVLGRAHKAEIVFEDSFLLVLEKPSGLVVNRAQSVKEETLQDLLSSYLGLKRGDLGIGDRAGIVHRLDRETSGLLIVAKTQKVFDFLQNEFAKRNVEKEYLGLVHGLVKEEEGLISRPLGRVGKFGKFAAVSGGKESVTEYFVLDRYQTGQDWMQRVLADAKAVETKPRLIYLKANAAAYSMLLIKPKTGRTHQIRVHLKSISHPVVSDLIYCPGKLIKFDLLWCPRLYLHASRLVFKRSESGKTLEFTSTVPADLGDVILSLDKYRL